MRLLSQLTCSILVLCLLSDLQASPPADGRSVALARYQDREVRSRLERFFQAARAGDTATVFSFLGPKCRAEALAWWWEHERENLQAVRSERIFLRRSKRFYGKGRGGIEVSYPVVAHPGAMSSIIFELRPGAELIFDDVELFPVSLEPRVYPPDEEALRSSSGLPLAELRDPVLRQAIWQVVEFAQANRLDQFMAAFHSEGGGVPHWWSDEQPWLAKATDRTVRVSYRPFYGHDIYTPAPGMYVGVTYPNERRRGKTASFTFEWKDGRCRLVETQCSCTE